jgi:hypothetical protein
MTQTLDTPTQTPTQRAERWLQYFEEALRARDVARAAGMFADTSFWRDLISFSWNITTVEDPDGVTELLTETLDRTDPRPSPSRSRPTRPTASPLPGSSSRPPSVAGADCCGSSRRTASPRPGPS